MKWPSRAWAVVVGGAVAFYALGLSLAHYLGVLRRGDGALMGSLWLVLVLAGAWALQAAFEQRLPPARQRGLAMAFGFFAAAGMLTVALAMQGRLSPLAAWVQALWFFGAVFWAAPPLRLRFSGYGEVVLAAGLALLAPALAFVLQTGYLHRLLAMTGMPLFALTLAAVLAWDLPDYAAHLRREEKTLLLRLDWQMTMRLHDAAWVSGFALLAVDGWLGLPWEVLLPCGMALLTAAAQVGMMRRVAQGARPPWGWLRANAVFTVALIVYLLAVGFWRL